MSLQNSFNCQTMAVPRLPPVPTKTDTHPSDDSLYSEIPVVMTVDQMARILLIGRNAAYQLIRESAIKSIKNGRNIRVTRGALVDYLNSAPK